MTLDLATLTLIAGVIVTPIVTGIGVAIRRAWAKQDAEKAGYLAKIDALQDRLYAMQQEQIKAEQIRAASTGDTNQLLKTLAMANDRLTTAVDQLAKTKAAA